MAVSAAGPCLGPAATATAGEEAADIIEAELSDVRIDSGRDAGVTAFAAASVVAVETVGASATGGGGGCEGEEIVSSRSFCQTRLKMPATLLWSDAVSESVSTGWVASSCRTPILDSGRWC